MDKDQISLKDVLIKFGEWYRFLLSRWMTILLFGVFGGILGFSYAYFKKPIYTATTTFVLESGDGNAGAGLGQYAGLASMVGIDLGGGGGGLFQGDNILELYQSRTMIEKTLLSTVLIKNKEELLINYYIEFNDLRKKWEKYPELRDINFDLTNNTRPFSRLQDSVIREAVKDIRIHYLIVGKTDKKLNIVTVEVQSNDEFFSKMFNDQIVKNVNDFYVQTKTKKALQNVSILQHKTDSVRSVMNGAIYNAAVVSDATPNLNPSRQVQRTAPMQRAQFSAETNKEVLGELVKNLEMSKLSLLKETPLIQVVDEPIFPLEKTKISKVLMTILGFSILMIISAVGILVRGRK